MLNGVYVNDRIVVVPDGAVWRVRIVQGSVTAALDLDAIVLR